MSFGSPYLTLPDFTYHNPSTLEEALKVLGEYGDEAKVMGGGIGLIAFMKERLMSPTHVIDMKGVDELRHVDQLQAEGLRIGAAVTIAELLEGGLLRKHYTVLHEALSRVADPMIRRRATLVGNVCEAIPWVDSPPALIALDATVEVVGMGGKRTIPVSKFIRGPVDIDLGANEIVTAVEVPMEKGRQSAFEKFTAGSEFSLASVAVAISGERRKRNAAVVYGAVNSTPIRSPEVEQEISDGLNQPSIRRAAEVAYEKVECLDDVLATSVYRRHLVKVLTTRVLRRMIRG